MYREKKAHEQTKLYLVPVMQHKTFSGLSECAYQSDAIFKFVLLPNWVLKEISVEHFAKSDFSLFIVYGTRKA